MLRLIKIDIFRSLNLKYSREPNNATITTISINCALNINQFDCSTPQHHSLAGAVKCNQNKAVAGNSTHTQHTISIFFTDRHKTAVWLIHLENNYQQAREAVRWQFIDKLLTMWLKRWWIAEWTLDLDHLVWLLILPVSIRPRKLGGGRCHWHWLLPVTETVVLCLTDWLA